MLCYARFCDGGEHGNYVIKGIVGYRWTICLITDVHHMVLV